MNDNIAHDQWELWEVFVQESDNAPHTHTGSLRAADAETALQNARDVYARRFSITNIWVVRTKDITASTPHDAESFFGSIAEKAYRHPHFYKTTLE